MGKFLTEIWRFNNFQNGGRPTSWNFKNLHFLSSGLCRHAVLLFSAKFREIRQSLISYGQKSDFQDGSRRHLEF